MEGFAGTTTYRLKNNAKSTQDQEEFDKTIKLLEQRERGR
jgi:hypothetical protein